MERPTYEIGMGVHERFNGLAIVATVIKLEGKYALLRTPGNAQWVVNIGTYKDSELISKKLMQ